MSDCPSRTPQPRYAQILRMANTVLTGIGYVAYPLLLVLLFIFSPVQLPRTIIVPAVGFVLCTVIRSAINLPRPYETQDTTPIIPKTTSGKSFPSRHAFCMFTIALSWLAWHPATQQTAQQTTQQVIQQAAQQAIQQAAQNFATAVGMALLIMACLLAVIRVLGGVHFTKDVIAGAILAIIVCSIGYWVI